MECLYHYCANETCINILKGHNIRLSNINKSNDSLELQLFFPDLHREILRKYEEKPFPFHFGKLENSEAMRKLIRSSEEKWQRYFQMGIFSNFVACFSEVQDSLSQWRGYADDGKGCCIGFSKELLRDYCNNSNGVLRMEQVTYVTKEEINQKITDYANEILNELSTVNDWVLKQLDYTYGIASVEFTLDRLVESAFIDSLSLKTIPFHEEREWRIFLTRDTYAKSIWIPNAVDGKDGKTIFFNSLAFVRQRVDFRITQDDIIPFLPIKFSEFSQNPVIEIWLGPKNKSQESDFRMFLWNNKYLEFEIHHSNITYR